MPRSKHTRSKSNAGADAASRRAEAAGNSAAERLQKVLAASGVGSRRDCEELITEGRVQIDKQVVTELGTKVDPLQQEIRVDGELIRKPKRLYFVVNKPVGIVTTNFDPSGRTRVIDLVPTEERVFPVGRLDRSSEGLIVVTNDGAFANRLTHPRYGVEKTYLVRVAGNPGIQQLDKLRRGVHLSDGFCKVDRLQVKSRHKQSTDMVIVLNEGRNREVRRILARVGHKVLRLRRVAVGKLKLGDLPIGAWRRLMPKEVEGLLEESSHIRARAKRPARPQQLVDELGMQSSSKSRRPKSDEMDDNMSLPSAMGDDELDDMDALLGKRPMSGDDDEADEIEPPKRRRGKADFSDDEMASVGFSEDDEVVEITDDDDDEDDSDDYGGAYAADDDDDMDDDAGEDFGGFGGSGQAARGDVLEYDDAGPGKPGTRGGARGRNPRANVAADGGPRGRNAARTEPSGPASRRPGTRRKVKGQGRPGGYRGQGARATGGGSAGTGPRTGRKPAGNRSGSGPRSTGRSGASSGGGASTGGARSSGPRSGGATGRGRSSAGGGDRPSGGAGRSGGGARSSGGGARSSGGGGGGARPSGNRSRGRPGGNSRSTGKPKGKGRR